MTAPTSGTALAVVTPSNVKALLTSDGARAVIEPYLPKGTDLDRVIATVKIALSDNPALGKCSTTSLVRAVAKIQQWGLEVGYTAHLVPFGTVCTPIADYKGLAQLVLASKAVRSIDLRVVYEKEQFSIQYGTDPKIEHIPLHRKADRGAIIGAYVVFGLPFGRSTFDFMGADDIDEIRQKHSKQWKAGPLPAWYAAKTILRKGVKILPKDPRLAEALQVVTEEEREEVEPIAEGQRVYALSTPDDDLMPMREPGDEGDDVGEAPF